MNFILFIIMIFTMPLLFGGMVTLVKSLWAGRKGPSVFQFFYDFFKLTQKKERVAKETSFLFESGPSLYLASAVSASLLIPYGSSGSVLSFSGDFVFFAYIMAFGNFYLILSALDTGSSFEGMGASREALFALFIEPSVFIIMLSFIYLSGRTSISGIMSNFDFSNSYSVVASILAVISFFIIMVSEGKRVPVDDPNTHLELTMIHEVMVLDHSGLNLAFVNYATLLKMTLFNALICAVIFPGLSPAAYALAFICVNLLSAFVLGTAESVMARFKMSYVPQFLLFLLGLAVFIASSVLISRGAL